MKLIFTKKPAVGQFGQEPKQRYITELLNYGIVNVDKPKGPTSHQTSDFVKKILKLSKAGHSGTLDPLASGLMVLLIGEATKLSQYVTEGNKSYQVGLRLGVTTDTLDITGTVLSEKPVSVSPEKILDVALHLSGELSLPVPIFSAKKIDGKKLGIRILCHMLIQV